MTSQTTYEIDEARLAEAASWHARLMDEAAVEADWIAFTEWLEADSRNADAYDRIEDVAATLDQPADMLAEALAEHSAPSNVISAAHRFGRPRMWAGVAAAAAAVWLAVINVGGMFSSPPATHFYETTDNTQLITLGDGSTVNLNVNTRLSVTMMDDERRTALEHGEALFTVTKDQERPFFVALGDRQVQVVGTAFNILRHSGAVTVTVTEGIVDVAATDAKTGVSTERLTAGKQLHHQEGTLQNVVTEVNSAIVTSWQEGFLEYEGAPLSKVIEDLNRYFKRPIQIDDTLADLTFSGILSTKDQQAVLDLLANSLPIHMEATDEAIMLTRKTEG